MAKKKLPPLEYSYGVVYYIDEAFRTTWGPGKQNVAGCETEEDPFCCGIMVVGGFEDYEVSKRSSEAKTLLLKKIREGQPGRLTATINHEQYRKWAPAFRAAGWKLAGKSFTNKKHNSKVYQYYASGTTE